MKTQTTSGSLGLAAQLHRFYRTPQPILLGLTAALAAVLLENAVPSGNITDWDTTLVGTVVYLALEFNLMMFLGSWGIEWSRLRPRKGRSARCQRLADILMLWIVPLCIAAYGTLTDGINPGQGLLMAMFILSITLGTGSWLQTDTRD